MVMTRSGGSRIRKLVKGSSSAKGKTFDQEGSTMDPIVMKPIRSALLATLVPYGTSKDKVPNVEASGHKESSPSTVGPNPDTSNVQTTPETIVPGTVSEAIEEDQLMPLHWVKWVRQDSIVEIPKSLFKWPRQLIDESLNLDWSEPEKNDILSSSESLPPPP